MITPITVRHCGKIWWRAVATTLDLETVRSKIRQGLDELGAGMGIAGKKPKQN